MNERHNHGDITYTHGLMSDLTEKPQVSGTDIWQVHFYMHDDYRFTWDVSSGQVFEVREEHFKPILGRYYMGWTGKVLPI